MLARAFAVFSVCLVSFTASAQQVQPPPVIYQLRLEAKHVGEIVDALSELQFKRVAPVIQEIGRQVQEQNAARAFEKKTPATPLPPAQEAPK